MKRKANSRNRGSVALLAFIAVVPLVAAIGGFAVDCMHVNDAKGALQLPPTRQRLPAPKICKIMWWARTQPARPSAPQMPSRSILLWKWPL